MTGAGTDCQVKKGEEWDENKGGRSAGGVGGRGNGGKMDGSRSAGGTWKRWEDVRKRDSHRWAASQLPFQDVDVALQARKSACARVCVCVRA